MRWKHAASKKDGILASVRFTVPLDQAETWSRSNAYQDVGQTIPGVQAVRYIERSDTREIIELDVKVLWRELTLHLDIEKQAPGLLRFQMRNPGIGEYRGLCRYEAVTDPATGQPATEVDLSTWLVPAKPIPLRLLLAVERMAMLQGAKRFLEAAEQPPKTAPAAPAP